MNMWLQTKKGVSIMIGYVLLVTFAVIMSVIIYSWMKTYIPTETLEAPEGVSMFVKEYQVSGDELSLTLKNNGRFSIGGYFITVSNDSTKDIATIDISSGITSGGVALNPGVKFLGQDDNPLKPGEEVSNTFDVTGVGNIEFIEITPIRWQEVENQKRLVVATNAKIKEILVEGGCTGCTSSESCIDGQCIDGVTYISNMNGIVAWWRFEGNANDEIGSSDGTVTGPIIADGKYGSSYKFDGLTGTGSGDYITLGDNSNLEEDNFSISVWVKKEGDGDRTGSILSKYSSSAAREFIFSYAIDTDVIYLTVYNAAQTGKTLVSYTIPSGSWYHVVVTKEGENAKMYVNGNLVNSSSDNNGYETLYHGGALAMIGAIQKSTYTPDLVFNGSIDELMYFDRAINSTEVHYLYNIELTTQECNIGEYTGEHWTIDSANSDPQGITHYGNYFWILDDASDKVYKYDLEGNLEESWDLTYSDTYKGILTNGSFIGISESYDIDIYDMDGVYNEDDYFGLSDPAEGLATYNSYLWYMHNEYGLYKELITGYGYSTYVYNFALDSSNEDSTGIAVYDDYVWIVDSADDVVYEYSDSGQNLLRTWELYPDNTDPTGMTSDGATIWIVDSDGEVYEYVGPNGVC